MSQNRQLAAIMFTDIEGYTALMQHDEKNAIVLRDRHRSIFEKSTKKHKGKIIQYFGDGTLSVFKSTVEAVDCATEMQLLFLQDPEIPVRIGIHVGDIVYTDEDIIGDAVNIASRIESCAISGSILISDKVHDQIRSHTHIQSKFLNAYDLKNVDSAVPIFAIANPGLKIPKPEEVKGKLSTHETNENGKKSYKKTAIFTGIALLLSLLFVYYQFYQEKELEIDDYSIAVLPFDNLSTDEDAELFRDGMTEDILTYLAKIKELRVISRTSVMQYKKTKKTIPEIAKELGVSLVLEGSIRKYGDQIKITAQLINAKTDEHLWAGDYDRTLTDIFKLQSEVSQEIVDALELKLSFDEEEALAIIPTKNIEAYKLYLTGRNEADKRTKESLAKSIELYEEAIVLDPNYAEAYAEIANSIYLETYYTQRPLQEASKTAREYLDKAEKISDKISRIYSVRGIINVIDGKQEEALAAFEKAIKLSPNDLTTRHQFSAFYFYTRQPIKQLEQAEIAYRLDPLAFATVNSYFNALVVNKKFEDAEEILDKMAVVNTEVNPHIINVSYFRLFMDQKKYDRVIEPLKEMVLEEKAFNRFLAYSYAQVGDTVNALKTIDVIRETARDREKSHQLALAYAGLKVRDSVLYYLDTVRHKQLRTLKREYKTYFDFLKDDPVFLDRLKMHGIN